LLGPGLGGTLVQLLGVPLAMGLDALSFLGSTALLGSIRSREPDPVPRQADASLWRELREGFTVTFDNRALRSLASTAAAYNLFGQWFEVLFLLYAVTVLHLEPTVLGLILSAGAVGALIGSLTAVRIGRAIGMGPAVVWTVGLESIVLVPAALVGDGSLVSLVALGAIHAVNGFGLTVSSVHAISIRQGVTPDHQLGRMIGSYRFISYGVIPVGAMLGGLVGELLGVRIGLLIGAIGAVSSVLFVLPLRSMRTLAEASS